MTVNTGENQFARIREQGAFYIDKTGFIKEWWDDGSAVTLIMRPLRFGKTLNMSMIECFFSNKYVGRADLFEGLEVWNDERYRQIQGTYPVVFLRFAEVKADNFMDMKAAVKAVIAKVYEMHREIMQSNKFDENDREFFAAVNENMDDVKVYTAISKLCTYLERYYRKDVIILLDDSDTPMQDAWRGGYWDEAASFFGSLLGNMFKANPHLYRGIITGITRIPEESIFSGLNNLDVITTTSNEYATSFGFTEEEVFGALDDMGLGDKKQGVKQWYDGFAFGKYTDIYNPWSITSFIRKEGKYAVYWSNTSGNSLVNFLIRQGNTDIKQIMEELLKGGSFKTMIDEEIVFDQLDNSTSAVWSLLLATGYLKVLGVESVGEYKDMLYTLALTNTETLIMFENMVRGWFGGDTGILYNEFIRAMLCDNVKRMNIFMNKVALRTFSSFDSGTRSSDETKPEHFYHGIVLGMVVNLADRYNVQSNHESGYGRYDLIIEPFDKTEKAFILEFKVLDADEDESTLQDTLVNAHRQIREKCYHAELIAKGFLPEQVRAYGLAFRGKECLIG